MTKKTAKKGGPSGPLNEPAPRRKRRAVAKTAKVRYRPGFAKLERSATKAFIYESDYMQGERIAPKRTEKTVDGDGDPLMPSGVLFVNGVRTTEGEHRLRLSFDKTVELHRLLGAALRDWR